MGKKVLKTASFGLIGKKKRSAAPTEPTGPVITPLSPEEMKKRMPMDRRRVTAQMVGTILSSKLGAYRQGLGG
jgi:hypothetical protein